MIKVIFVCHGNICRSTMAESLFTHMVKEKNIAEKFFIDSAGTSSEECGNPVHPGTIKKLRENSIELVPHRARKITKEDFKKFDFIIGMDDKNIKNLERMFGISEKFFKLLNFSGLTRDIRDPWYTGNFDETFSDIKLGLDGFFNYLKEEDLLED